MKNERYGAEEIYLAPEMVSTKEITEKNSELIDEVINEDALIAIEAESKKTIRISEILDMREENRKVFHMSDGSEQAVFCPETIHVFNKDTNIFEDVNNTLVEDEDGRCFINGNNRFKARFSREEENDDLFSIEYGSHRITVSAKKNSKQRSKGIKPKLHRKLVDGVESADALIFTDVQEGVNFEYSVTGNGVKENIVVNEKTDIYRYPFIVRQENVSAEFDEGKKRIVFVSNETGKEVFCIPAPFMIDKNGVVSDAVSYEVKNAANGNLVLNIVADSEWMNATERAFPVIIDPQVQLSGASAMNTYSWDNGNLYNSSLHTVGTQYSGGNYNAKRMYMSFNMPTLPRNPRIKKAELKFCQASSSSACGNSPKLGLYRVTEDIFTGNCTPEHDFDLIDFAKMRIGHQENGEVVSYTFDVTTLVDLVNKGEFGVKNLVLKMIQESSECDNSIVLYGCSYNGIYAPKLIITYESSYSVNTSCRTHTHELGRFGQGSIDLHCGNLMFESEDFAWAGNRMPVTIKHLYNSALSAYQYTANSTIKLPTADFSAMNVGNGFKLNIMQSMMYTSFQHEGIAQVGYVYIGENGEEVYFKKSDVRVRCDNTSQCYHIYEDINDGSMLYDHVKRTLKQGDDIYQFDSMGRLIKITDAAGNHMDIGYTSNRISSVTDGAGRDFWFAYSGNFLTSVTAPDNTKILYTYSDNLLSTITYSDGKKVSITYASDKPAAVTLLDASGNNVYKVGYSFLGDHLSSVTEYGADESVGAKSTYSYSVAAGRTLVETTEARDVDAGETADNVIKTVYAFDDDGNVVSEYAYSQDIGNTGVNGEESGIHPHSGDGGVGVVSNINNLLSGHNFESLSAWSSMPNNSENLYVRDYPYEVYTKFGKSVLRMQSYQADCTENGVYQVTNLLPVGQYTFSVYIRVLAAFSGTDAGAFIRVVDASGNILGISERLDKYDAEYTRLIVPFELASEQCIQVQILINGKGTMYADAAQLENNPYANAYNMLENGNFENGTYGWNKSVGASHSMEACFNMSGSLKVSGSLDAARYAYQQPVVRTSRSTRETFTLSGWAKGYGLPCRERDGVPTPAFRLRALVKYYDTYYREYGSEVFTADFSPCTEEWQFASVQFSKSKYRTIQYIRVYCDYNYSNGTVYFDDIQLVRNSLETGLVASDFVVESTGGADDEEIVENTDSTPTFNEAKDKFGNALTETTFTDGEFGTIYRSFGYKSDCNCAENAGNDLLCETDARGYMTTYVVDEDTSRNEEVVDRCGNKTAYEYDTAGKTTKVTSKNAEGCELANVSYTYDAFDNMTEIVRGDGMKYALAYNQFHNLESIGVDGKAEKLISYTYKNGNGRLKEMKYANGDTMKATYNSIGQMVTEAWFDKNDVETARYKYVYDGGGNIVQSLDITNKKCYNYEYEEERIVRATESNVTFSGEIISSKTVVNTVKYCYDAEGNMTKKVISFVNGSEQTVYYETSDDNTTVKFSAGGRTVTSHSKTDSFGRKVFDELQLGTDFVSRQFVYHAGKVTDAHKNNAKVKSSATTQLVSQIILSNGTTLAYGYDAEERITSVEERYEVDNVPVTNITLYTYDALGQLLTETVNGEVVNSMKYDNYGNIIEKNGKKYTYGDAAWKDLLTAFDGETIAYDAQGNPVQYLGYTLTWEKGRQLKRFVKSDGTAIDYTYNANGVRTSKTVNGVLHTYTLDGTKILCEEWNGNTLVPLYDNEDSVCGILYNNVPYYFIKNLQGDVVSMVDKEAQTVAKYAYDAWGACTSVRSFTELTNGVDIAAINPFRYRGYYYDLETGLYYVSSRYYDPEVGRWLNSDDPMFLGATGNIASYNLFAYCENNPVNYKDPSGYGPVGTIIGGILGFGLGALLVPRVADLLKLKGWGRKVFIWAGVAALTGLGAYVGNYVGKAIFAVYKAGGAFAAQINKAIAKGISKLVGGTLKSASGNGWVINIKKIVVRVMTSSNYRNNYFKISVAGKAAYDILGNVSSDPAKIHIPITFNSIIKLVQLIFKLK